MGAGGGCVGCWVGAFVSKVRSRAGRATLWWWNWAYASKSELSSQGCGQVGHGGRGVLDDQACCAARVQGVVAVWPHEAG